MKPLRKLLVANRGEIACRVIRGAREAGLATIAIYSEPDARAPHVRLADEAVPIGPGPARESYLDAEKIVRAALERHADAIHPGYGFLAENARFAALCEEAGLAFVGPRPQTIALMGEKAHARAVMRDVGVPIIPGTGELRDPEEAIALGFPLILKASAGGGGIGMQLCRDEGELRKAFPIAKQRAAAVFRSDALYAERYIERARHVEAQVLGDGEGGIVHLFERECSIQRRHQKVVEEAPAGIPPEKAAALLEAAVRGAAHVKYRGAGTLEFLFDAARGEFYFIEMNTRIQVEHPVTEMTTGVDIVRAQIAIARGEGLPSEVRRAGHAIECRVYAEDPARGFAPSPGRLGEVAWPTGEGVRCDFGYESGQQVTPFYDPLLAKVVAWGETRARALERLAGALERTAVEGVRTNVAMLRRLAADPEFRRGDGIDTGFLARRKDLLA